MSAPRRISIAPTLVIVALVVASCSSSGGSTGSDSNRSDSNRAPTSVAADVTDTNAAAVPPADTTPTTTAAPPRSDATFQIIPGTEQVTVLDATPGEALEVVDVEGTPLAAGVVDEVGALVFRDLPASTPVIVRSESAASRPVATMRRDEHPGAAFYAEQRLVAPGFGYITTRDGTTLSATVRLPGPVDGGPYPTVIEYSGYSPSDPDAAGFPDLFTALGYAYVGVNMRGTGCSGGSFRYFEYVQSLDGYDVVEAVAAQPWVLDHRVGMVGVSYPGLSQLFVAQTKPPSLAAITPLSVLDDSYQANLYPGGILNTGFAVEWTTARVEEARPAGQAWAAARIDAGDETCAANQRLRLQNPDLLAEITSTPFWVSPLGDELAPRTFVDEIEVPVFLAGAWQDEQTGGRFPTMIDRFTGTDRLFVSLVNGLHTESISPAVIPRYVEFLDLYVARRTPTFGVLGVVAPILGAGIFGTSDFALPPERFSGLDHAQALEIFEAEPRVHVLFEQGAADGFGPSTPMPRFVEMFDTWPIPGAVATRWYLDGSQAFAAGPLDGGLVRDAPLAAAPGSVTATEYVADADAVPATYYTGSASGIWRADVSYDWRQNPEGTVASFATEPLERDLVMVGSGSADLWITAEGGDTDLEVTLSEIRPDGTEVLIQGGWLRASHRALDRAASTELRPVHTHLETDAAPLRDGQFELVRVEIYPFAHVVRAGSRLRMSVDAPGGNRAVWAFDTIADGERVAIAHDADHPSSLVLSVIPGIQPPAGYPACGALRGQPCRRFP